MARSLAPALSISEGDGLLAARWTARFGALQIRGVAAHRGGVRVLARTSKGEEIVDLDGKSGDVVVRRPAPEPLTAVLVSGDGWIIGTTYRGADDHRELLFIDPDGNVAARHPEGETLFAYGAEAGPLQILAGRDGRLRGYRDGVLEWTYAIPGPDAYGGGPLAADHRSVTIGSSGTVYRLDLAGSQQWTWRAPLQLASSPEISPDDYDARAQAREELGERLRRTLGGPIEGRMSEPRWDRSDLHSRPTADGQLSAYAAARITDVRLSTGAVVLGDSDSRVWSLDATGCVVESDRICREERPVRLLVDEKSEVLGAIAGSTVATIRNGRVVHTGRIGTEMHHAAAVGHFLIAWDSFTVAAWDLERKLRFVRSLQRWHSTMPWSATPLCCRSVAGS